MNETPKYNLPELYANLPQYLIRAQADLESAIEAYGVAGDLHAAKEAEYRRAKASAIKQLREEKQPVGVISDLVQGIVADQKESEMKADSQMKRCKMAVESIHERINMLKFLGRGCDSAGANNQQRG